jgi:hypothetical protein
MPAAQAASDQGIDEICRGSTLCAGQAALGAHDAEARRLTGRAWRGDTPCELVGKPADLAEAGGIEMSAHVGFESGRSCGGLKCIVELAAAGDRFHKSSVCAQDDGMGRKSDATQKTVNIGISSYINGSKVRLWRDLLLDDL